MKIDPAIKEDLKQYLMEKIHDAKKTVTIVSPYSLSSNDIEQIRNQFSYLKNAKIETETDKNLLAGFIIKFGTKMIDLSLRRKLDEIVQSATQL